MRCDLERFQRIDIQVLVNSTGELRPEPRDRAEQLLRADRAAQALELRPATGAHHLRDRPRQHGADPRQGIEALDALALEQHRHVLVQLRQSLGRAAVGAHAERVRLLLFEQLGRLAQPVRDLLVQQACPPGPARRRGVGDRQTRLQVIGPF